MSFVEVLDVIAMAMLAVAGVLGVWRVVREGSVADKLLGADLLTVIVVGGVAVGAGVTSSPLFLDVIVLVAALGFLAAVTVARYIEKRGARFAGDDWT
ncbi:MAG: monovalent cation/H+ antiporter complex subunit F [Actinomycetota bacterium]